MCHFVEENIGFNLEIAFIEYFLCKTVFYNKTNTIYYLWNSPNWGYFTILPVQIYEPFSYFTFSSVSKIKYNLWNLM